MNGFLYYKSYPRDFFEGTIGMPFELKAAYRLVLDLIYMQGGRLPDDSKYISGLLGCSVRSWHSYRSELVSRRKIIVENGIISNFRADKELESLRSFQEKQRENGSKSNKNKRITEAMAEPKVSHTESEPYKERKKDSGKPESSSNDGFDEFWDAVPKKVAKGAAQKAYAKALRSTDAATLIAGMRAYAEVRRGQDPTYTAHPASWLNAGRWSDETAPNGGDHGKPDRLAAMLRGAAGPPPLDSWQGGHASQPLLARR